MIELRRPDANVSQIILATEQPRRFIVEYCTEYFLVYTEQSSS